jgi:hypothetical protein
MPKNNPFENIFEQISDLLSMTHEKSEKPLSEEKLDENIGKQIDELEKGVEIFRKITDEALKRSGIDEENLKKTIRNPSAELLGKDKRILEKAKKLRGELEAIEREYARKSQVVKLQKKQSKTAGKKRKKKFKRLGGQGWIPL